MINAVKLRVTIVSVISEYRIWNNFLYLVFEAFLSFSQVWKKKKHNSKSILKKQCLSLLLVFLLSINDNS